MRTEPLHVTIEAPGKRPIPVTLKGRTAAGVRKVAEAEGLPVADVVRRLFVEGMRIVRDRDGRGRP